MASLEDLIPKEKLAEVGAAIEAKLAEIAQLRKLYGALAGTPYVSVAAREAHEAAAKKAAANATQTLPLTDAVAKEDAAPEPEHARSRKKA